MQPSDAQPSPEHTPHQGGLFDGRLGRSGYLMGFIYVSLYFVLIVAIVVLFRNTGARVVGNIAAAVLGIVGGIACIVAGISMPIRRWHDLNKSGWWMLLSFVPLVNIVVMIIYLFVPGTRGPNDYGSFSSSLNWKRVLFNK